MFRMFALREKEIDENQELIKHYNYYKIFNNYNKLGVLYNIVYHVLMIYRLWVIPSCYISAGQGSAGADFGKTWCGDGGDLLNRKGRYGAEFGKT